MHLDVSCIAPRHISKIYITVENLPDWDFFERNWTWKSWNMQGGSPPKTPPHWQCEMPGHSSTKRHIHSWYGLIPHRAFRIAFEGIVVARLASRFEGSCSCRRWLALVVVVASSWCQLIFLWSEWILKLKCRHNYCTVRVSLTFDISCSISSLESINQDYVFSSSLTLR